MGRPPSLPPPTFVLSIVPIASRYGSPFLSMIISSTQATIEPQHIKTPIHCASTKREKEPSPATIGSRLKFTADPTRENDSAMPNANASSLPLNQRAENVDCTTLSVSLLAMRCSYSSSPHPPTPNRKRPASITQKFLIETPKANTICPARMNDAKMKAPQRGPR